MVTDTKNVPDDVLTTGTVRGDGLQPGMLERGVVTDVAATEVIPVLREELKVSKREVETGRVVVHKTVSERDENVEMLLRRTDVSVERVPVGRTVTEAPASREEGDVLIIPVMEEVLVVEKRLILKEELHIRKTTTERTAHEVVRLRTETARIEPSGNVSVTGDTSKEI